MIVGETWPAWLPVVPALGAKVSVIMCDAIADLGEMVIQDAAWLEVNSRAAETFVRESSGDTLMFVSGSAKFFMKWRSVFEGKGCLVLARVSGALSRRRGHEATQGEARRLKARRGDSRRGEVTQG